MNEIYVGGINLNGLNDVSQLIKQGQITEAQNLLTELQDYYLTLDNFGFWLKNLFEQQEDDENDASPL